MSDPTGEGVSSGESATMKLGELISQKKFVPREVMNNYQLVAAQLLTRKHTFVVLANQNATPAIMFIRPK